MTTDHIAGHLRPGGSPPGGVRDSAGVRVEQHRLPATYAAFAALPAATADETAAVAQVLARFGHAIDNADQELLAQVFVDPPALEPATSPSHHVVNTEVKRVPAGLAAWSRLVTIAGDGSVASADVLDVLAETPAGWRVARRTVHPRHGGPAVIGDGDGEAPWA
ncbi:hypothetical protein [Pseudofrankia inefficax]|uniref:SnoaL-like domain-containing protein n=1 Tax=Pseudofrankia inefficax (strain DSM 45817 / CECT 9037 / DDB 130130 / EuI1c) TaxID=298654 RepID=E3JAN2_PSEI1|nr:hypothetical protein [Pseudofrankia inefficax]ADP82224.1 hypothetical protein FraEuI1c_4225 [Pseudofrankia inefficax]